MESLKELAKQWAADLAEDDGVGEYLGSGHTWLLLRVGATLFWVGPWCPIFRHWAGTGSGFGPAAYAGNLKSRLGAKEAPTDGSFTEGNEDREEGPRSFQCRKRIAWWT